MPAYHIDRSLRIEAPESRVRPAIEDFAEWPKWSPWLCMEPSATVNVHGTPGQVGHGYDWEGQLVGAGKMQIASVANDVQRMDLEFFKPFRSKAFVKMEIKPAGDSQTDVTWHMDGKMPFFLFFMIRTMKSMIGMDYTRGLKMLKEYVETGTVKSRTEIVGVVDVPQTHYIGIEAHCTMDGIGESMGETLPRALQLASDNSLEMAGPPGALYNRIDLKQQNCHYTTIVPVKSAAPVAGTVSGQIVACKALKVTHHGSYKHLGNAWSTLMAEQRYKKMKPLKSQCAFEFYPSDPDNTAEEELMTEIYLPIRR